MKSSNVSWLFLNSVLLCILRWGNPDVRNFWPTQESRQNIAAFRKKELSRITNQYKRKCVRLTWKRERGIQKGKVLSRAVKVVLLARSIPHVHTFCICIRRRVACALRQKLCATAPLSHAANGECALDWIWQYCGGGWSLLDGEGGREAVGGWGSLQGWMSGANYLADRWRDGCILSSRSQHPPDFAD